ncbi:MAG: hypothetical protein PHQ05_07030 [Sterolibacterium sp.]|nr:hypothetical protein [Sterolibacterium sp.]
MKLELILAIALTVLVGCDSKPKNEPLPPPPQMIKDQKQTLDNARDIGDVIEKQGEEQRKKLEEATK